MKPLIKYGVKLKMTNGNDYIEIEEAHTEQIHEDYCKDKCLNPDTFKYDNIPENWIIEWIDNYLQR